MPDRRSPRLADPLALSLRDDARRDLTVRAYQVRATTLDATARTVEAVLATENPVWVFDLRTWSPIREILVIDGMQGLPDQVPLLDNHNRDSTKDQLGSTRNLRVEGGKLIGLRAFSSVADAVDAFTKVREGHLRDGSIGYRVRSFTDLDPGASFEFRGRAFSNDGADTLRISYDWSPIEDSITPIGADPDAKVRASTTPSVPTQESAMKLEDLIALYGEHHRSLLIQLLADKKSAQEIAQSVLSAERAAGAASTRTAPTPPPAAPATTPTPAPAGAGDEAARAAGIAAERSRIKAIRELAGTDIPADQVQRACDEGWTVERSTQAFLESMRARRPAPVGAGATITEDAVDKFRLAAQDAFLCRADPHGLSIARALAPERRTAVRSLIGIGLQDLARECLRMERQDAPLNVEELFKRSLSTVSLPDILGGAYQRMLVGAYEEAPSTILEWAGVEEAKDFRSHALLKLGKFASVDKVGPGGEIAADTLQQAKESYSVDTYAKRFAITRQQFINDDLGAFTRVPMELGAADKRNIDDIGYSLLTSAAGLGPTMGEDGLTMFLATTHTPTVGAGDGINYKTGGTTVLSSAGLTAMKTLFRKIKQSGAFLNLIPKVLVVPPELEQTARELVYSSQIVISEAGSTTNATTRGNVNVHAGTLKVVVEPRLSGGTDGTTAWYLVCDPIQARSIIIAFLRGQTVPVVERKDPTDVLGIGWRMYHDVGAAAGDWRGIVRAKGA